jgi:hypothetical protein
MSFAVQMRSVGTSSGVKRIHKDGEATADEHEEEEQVGIMAPAHPERKAVRTARSALGRGLRRPRVPQPEDRMLQLNKQYRRQHQYEHKQ